jgi:predicted ester cyclase
VIAEGDWVAVQWSMRGTHTGDFAHPTFGSAPASGKSIQMTYMDHYRIAGGRIAEAWETRDALALLQQLGVIPAPGQPPA